MEGLCYVSLIVLRSVGLHLIDLLQTIREDR
jgi:hypothetical protein